MGATTKPALMDSGKAIAVSIALGIVIAFMPLFSFVAVPALPIPVAFITSRYGFFAGLIVSLLAGMVCMLLTAPLLGVYAGVLILMLAVMAGIGGGLALRRGTSQLRLFIYMVTFFFVALILWLGVLLLIVGMGPVSAVDSVVNAAVEPSSELYRSMGMSEQDIDSLVSQARDFASTLPYMAPGLLLIVSLVLSVVNLAVAKRVFERLRQPFPRDFIFRDFRVHWAFAYVFILGLICQLLAPYAPDAYSSAVELVGANLYIVTTTLFFIQGMAVACFFLWAFRLSRAKRVAVYAGLILIEVVLSLTMWLGLFDTWIDYRRRFASKKRQG